MTSEKILWLCEQYAHKAWTLSLGFAQEAGRSGHFGRGYAIVAEEARTLANKLFDYTAKAKFESTGADDFKGIVDFAVMTGFLAVNSMIEILRVNPVISDMSINKSIAVLAEELRRLAIDINALADTRAWEKPFVIPEITSPLKSTNSIDYFFRFSIGGIPLVENTSNIMEVLYGIRKADAQGDTLSVRGNIMRNLNLYKRFALSYEGLYTDMQTFMIIQTEGTRYLGNAGAGTYAVPIDDLDIFAIFQSKIGCAVPPNTDSAFAPFARECWDVIDGGQLMFADWQKLGENWEQVEGAATNNG